MAKAKGGLRGAWRIAIPYWTSEEKWSAWGLLLGVVALNLGTVYINVRINQWNNAFYDALQAFNGGEFFRQIIIFCVWAGLFIIMSVYALYLNQMLQIRWRRWLTRKYLRFSLVRVRENAESIALYSGEPVELRVFAERFKNVFENFWQIMKRQKRLTWFTAGYAQAAIIFPVIAVAPRYFAKQIQLGGLMQVVNAFSSVQSALSFIITSYTDIATWQAVTERLSGFAERLRAVREKNHVSRQIVFRAVNSGLIVENLDLDLPDGTPLLCGIEFSPDRGGAMLISGPIGAGKSTLLRAIAGLWPFGRGEIRIGEGSVLFLPQRPYLPLGTLASALLYPSIAANNGTRARLPDILEEVGPGTLTSKLDELDHWSQRLSPGEKQRLAFARILLNKPALLFLDEATSAMDESSEAELYRLLLDAPWQPTSLSVGHRTTLRSFHDQVIDIGVFAVRSGADGIAA
jgi:putative ATP-binding cassette transporter